LTDAIVSRGFYRSSQTKEPLASSLGVLRFSRRGVSRVFLSISLDIYAFLSLLVNLTLGDRDPSSAPNDRSLSRRNFDSQSIDRSTRIDVSMYDEETQPVRRKRTT